MHIHLTQKAIIINKDGKILALKGAVWDLPGGDVALPELHAAALRATVKQQTGIEIWNTRVIGFDSAYDPGLDTYQVFVGHMLVVSEDIVIVELGAGYTEFGWFSVKDFLKLDVPLYLVEFVNKAANDQ